MSQRRKKNKFWAEGGNYLYPCKFCGKTIVDCGTIDRPKCCKKCKGARNHTS